MSAPILRGYGNLTMGGPGDATYPVDLPNRKIGDIIVVYAFGVNVYSTNDGHPETPGGFEELFINDDTVVFECVWAKRVADPDENLVLQKGVGTFVGAWMTIAWVVTNVTPLSTWRDDDVWKVISFGDGTGAVTVSGADRLVLFMFNGGEFFTDPGPMSGPQGFDNTPVNPADEPVANYSGWHNRIAFRSQVTSATVPALPIQYAQGQRSMAISFIGPADTALPTQPQPGRVALGCARSYTAYITDQDYRTTIDVIGWSRINWERVLDDISNASVVIPDITGGVRCCIPHGGIEPWRFGLLIERNDAPVWNGGIVSISRDTNAQTTTVSASDPLVRYTKRFATREVVNWVNKDAGAAFADVINIHAVAAGDSWMMACPTVFTGAAVNRRVLPRQFGMAWDLLSELLDSAVDIFVMNGNIYVWEPGAGWRFFEGYKQTLEGPYNADHDLVYGLFTAEAFTQLPSWSVNGMTMANFVAIPGADSGEYGFREYFKAESAQSQLDFGLLDHADPNTLDLPEDAAPSAAAAVLQARANTVLALRKNAPSVTSGGVLSEDAPVDINGLRPGSIWQMDIFDACYGQLLTAQRLKRVQVSVTMDDGVKESVSPTLIPVGYEGGEILS